MKRNSKIVPTNYNPTKDTHKERLKFVHAFVESRKPTETSEAKSYFRAAWDKIHAYEEGLKT